MFNEESDKHVVGTPTAKKVAQNFAYPLSDLTFIVFPIIISIHRDGQFKEKKIAPIKDGRGSACFYDEMVEVKDEEKEA